MRTATRRSIARQPSSQPPAWLDASGVPLVRRSRRAARAPETGTPALAGLATGTLPVQVAGVAAEDVVGTLLWGTADGRSILFLVDPATADEMLEALGNGEQPVALVEPRQIVLEQLG